MRIFQFQFMKLWIFIMIFNKYLRQISHTELQVHIRRLCITYIHNKENECHMNTPDEYEYYTVE